MLPQAEIFISAFFIFKQRKIDMKKYVVFNQKVCGFLLLHGFVIKGIEKSNKPESKMNVFIFNDTEELRSKISEYDNFISNHKDYFIR
jgi:hypothetical protein